ncbi:peptidase S9 family protein [Gilvibacter sp. SZ-19]|uniref:S9 family peptidase n=3 Tax=Gilvibacter TaxID=379070 RepID=UPI000B3BE746|nr:S9 family peptidase [Gilvibacter sp. SZ-19]ARV13037.1 peptidase S9 family protein [Gilvibacter sp. SZ-19]
MRTLSLCLALFLAITTTAQEVFQPLDVFELEYAGDPQISPDGSQIVYRRTGFDIMEDRSFGNLWLLSADGKVHQKLTPNDVSEGSARWSPSGDRLVYRSSSDKGSEIFVMWMDSGRTSRLTQLEKSPSNLTWSPDGKWIAFTMKVDAKAPVIAQMPSKPKGAKWADAPRITDRLKHEADGAGYLKPGFTHIFVVPASGGTPRQLSSGDFNHGGSLSWTPDGKQLLFSANRNPDWEYDFRNSEVYALTVATGDIKALTSAAGPDRSPVVSPDGKTVAYLGYQDKVQTYQVTRLRLMNVDGTNKREVLTNLDRSVKDIQWSADGKRIYFMYDEFGDTKVAQYNLGGSHKVVAEHIGGTSLGRPYASGSYSVSKRGDIAFSLSKPDRPAEVALLMAKSAKPKQLTALNEDLLGHKTLGKVEELWYKASTDGRDLQAWVVYPPNYDPNKKYPMMIENHGGPILNYGDRFSAEIQLYAAAGYIVYYPNPRGSTGYGEEFGNLLFNNYPGDDYQDVMDGVDVLISKGIAHEDQLFVTGGSAGGIMTAWIIGKNNRFEAAVVAKPVMNWISKTLVADNYYGYANSRYPGQPWENFEGYWKFSPISLVGNVETPTMVMVGMNDLRTPPSEAKQLYHALKLRKIETVLVEIPDASHGIASRPSNLITKVAHTLAWFDKFRTPKN